MEIDEGMDEIAKVNVVNHDTTPFSDAGINTVPSLPEIKEGEPLPKDLQELVDRCTQLSETEKQELAKVLRKHHDIFAKDNATFAHVYHNLEIHPDDQPKTAIILPEGLELAHRQFEFTRLSFGLAAAPGAFQYITDQVITPAKVKTPENDLGETVSVYLDDICIGGDNFTQMLQKLEALFNRIRAAGFLLKAKKGELFQPKVSYLGHKLSEKGINTDQKKIDKILSWPAPTNVKEEKSWLEKKQTRLTTNTITVNWTKVVPDGMSPTDIRKAPLLDPDIMPIMVAVQDQKKPEFQEIAENSNKTRSLWFQFNSLVIEGGVVYRKFEHPSGLKEKEELQLILPTKLAKSTVKTYHEQLGVGNHFGVTKTLAYLKRFFWWPGMFEDTYEVVSRCKVCAKYKGPKHHTKVPLKLFQEGVLHGRWHVDICGPISPKSREGHEYILVAVEAFSGWPVVVPLYKQTADEIAQALITHVFCIFGAPQSLLPDQGKAFDSKLFQEIMELYQINPPIFQIGEMSFPQ
ncbi:hypothetical protein KUF71_000174 [Frankliniella fusca]|uniref:RNA-directed DNA polymerase n=1 Tax=Frankliniella fusca TaxID=407009 RepID=A0AAE1HJZ5_9NEOP|nr:hypothetical protein KUF71_000174 [Frankliniella fusca]